MTSITTDRLISTADVRRSLIERREIALLDVRDEASFAEAHPLFAASLPLDRVAGEVSDRIPRRTTPIGPRATSMTPCRVTLFTAAWCSRP